MSVRPQVNINLRGGEAVSDGSQKRRQEVRRGYDRINEDRLMPDFAGQSHHAMMTGCKIQLSGGVLTIYMLSPPGDYHLLGALGWEMPPDDAAFAMQTGG